MMGQYEDIVALEAEAQVAAQAGQDNAAVRAHRQALEIAQGLSRPRLLAALFNRLGETLEASGRIQDALIAYESGWRAIQADDGPVDVDQVLARLDVPSKSFQPDRFYGMDSVPDLYREVANRDLAAAETSPTLRIQLLINIGNAYLHQSQEDPALFFYNKALAEPEIADTPLRAYALANRGEVRRRSGDLDGATTDLDEAVRLFASHARPGEQRRALALLAGIARDRGEADRAAAAYEQALKLYAEADDSLGAARAYAGRGRLYLEQQRFAEAADDYGRALQLATSANDAETLWHTYWGLGCCQQAAGQLDAAAASFRQSLDLIAMRQDDLRTDEGKVTFLGGVQDVFDRLIAVHLERARTDDRAYEQALHVAEEARGRALSDLTQGRQRRRPLSGADGSSANEMAAGVPSGPDTFPPWAQMARAVPSGASEQLAAPSGEQDTAATVAAGSPALRPLARLVFHVLLDRTAIFVVTPDGAVRGHAAPIGCHALDARVEQLRATLGADDPRGVRLARQLHLASEPDVPTTPADPAPLLRSLYTELIAPISEALPTDGSPVVIEPHAALWLIPFAALLGPGDRWLADQWPLLYSPSAAMVDEIRQEPDYGAPDTLKALIVGNPTMPRVSLPNGEAITLEALPGAEAEAQAIGELFPEPRRTVLLRAAADRATVVAQAAQYGILHLATHGIAYADDPLASFVALAESQDGTGCLTARAVMDMVLPADLVVLSACQTGLGQVSGDGMIGLSRAFLVTGARAILVSQWSVSDEATALLMQAFYEGYLKQDNKAIALQHAMRVTRAKYPDPRFWAPFVVVGAAA